MAARVLIDGRSGSGKTELASLVARDQPSAQLVRLDDIYPGWDGLEAGSAAVHRQILTQFRWQRWDWFEAAPAEWHEIDPSLPIIVEGCGSLSAANRQLATFGVWVELDAPTRRTRALAREPLTYAPYWERWAAQEQAYIARESPIDRADLLIDGNDVAAEFAVLRSLLRGSMGE